MTTFIDKDSGAEWEQVDSLGAWVDGKVFIRPVKKPKWSVSMSKNFRNNDGLWYIDINSGTEVFDQAQLIKEAVEALMEFVGGLGADNGQWPGIVSTARNALNKGSDES